MTLHLHPNVTGLIPRGCEARSPCVQTVTKPFSSLVLLCFLWAVKQWLIFRWDMGHGGIESSTPPTIQYNKLAARLRLNSVRNKTINKATGLLSFACWPLLSFPKHARASPWWQSFHRDKSPRRLRVGQRGAEGAWGSKVRRKVCLHVRVPGIPACWIYIYTTATSEETLGRRTFYFETWSCWTGEKGGWVDVNPSVGGVHTLH